jgi:hypothetical protein
MLNVSCYELNIFLNAIHMKRSLFINLSQTGVADYLHLVNFQNVEWERGYYLSLSDALGGIFARESKNDVPTNEYSALVGFFYRFSAAGKVVSSVYSF